MKKDFSNTTIIQEYQQGATLQALADKYGSSKKTVSHFLKEKGVQVRPSNNVKKYTCNEDWLDEIDSAEKSYFLGMFFADGCNESNTNNVMIYLQDEDKEVLDRFNTLWESDRPLLFRKAQANGRQSGWCFYLNSAKVSSRLTTLGAPPKKSLTLKFPTNIDEKFVRDFIRGYFDGDGCISFRTNKTVRITIAGTHEFLTTLQNILSQMDIQSSIIDREYDKISVLSFCKKEYTIKFLKWIYQDSDLYIPRKHEKYLQFLQANDLMPEK